MSAKQARTSIIYYIARVILQLFFTLWCRLRVSGRAHIPATGPFIVVSNHASFLDPPILSVVIRSRTIHFMARDSLFGVGPIAWLLKKLNALPMDRERGDIGAIRLAVNLLASGEVLALFPEGTRTRSGLLQEAKGGIGLLIAKAKVPVLPVSSFSSF